MAPAFGMQSGFDMSSMSSPMRIPVNFKCDKDADFDLEIVSACELLNEPEREHSPESPRNYGARPGGVIPSFGSTVSDYDYPEYAEASAMDGVPSAMDGATEVISGNFVTAAAFSVSDWNVGVGANPMSSMFACPSIMPFGSGQQTMQSVEELDRAAEQLIAAAQQARAAAAQLKSGAHTTSASGPMYQPMMMQFPAQLPHQVRQATSSMQGHSERTTVMLRNLPNDYTREMVLDLLDQYGLAGTYDFVYLPVDFKRKAGLGYVFVNFSTPAGAEQAFEHLQGFTRWQYSSAKVLEVAWGEPLQGLDAHIERYRNSPVMHSEVPDQYRPMVFHAGMRVPFPSPTKKIQKPRMKA